LPDSHTAWAKAIAREVDAITVDSEALSWAVGGVLASYKEKVCVMNIGTPRIAPWILGLEVLICFIPLTLLGLAVLSALASGAMPLGIALLYLSGTAIGPIGLVAGFRAIVRRGTHLSQVGSLVMCLFAAWTVFAFFLAAFAGDGLIGDWWRESILIALLPAAGTAHLALLARRSAEQVVTS
jgi:hypothetical protein